MTTKKKKGYGLEIKTFHGKRRSMKRCVRADKLREALARTKMVPNGPVQSGTTPIYAWKGNAVIR